MKSVLGCVLVLLWATQACAEVLLQPDFNATKFSGLWFVVSMASDCKVFLGEKDRLLMSTRAVTASADGDLSVRSASPRPGSCDQSEAEYLRVGSQGHFRVPALGYLDVRVVDTDYISFAVLYIHKELRGALSTVAQLYSRTQDPSSQALTAFRDFYPTVGLSEDTMVMLPKSDTCSSAGREDTPAPPDARPGPSQAACEAQNCYAAASTTLGGSAFPRDPDTHITPRPWLHK
ncbi:lipocalin-15 [Talpa occidentalis]|uniref:lipocalin-15 n=1 Tax=Talpa occidentalis TaxID=50954 RepID=UPI0023F9CE88|nr:lipocalin-15 [Talpa occidentalis]